MNNENWYYARNNTRQGPVTLEILRELIRQGIVAMQDLVWTQGMADWQAAATIPDLLATLNQSPAAAGPPAVLNYLTPYPLDVEYGYAGFWMRVAACIIDGLIIILPACLASIVPYAGGIILGWLYFALMESSSCQATVGKLALGLRVTDMNGQRISFGRATGRHFGKWVSGLTLYIGFMMAGWTEKKQALHDMMANCLVVRTR